MSSSQTGDVPDGEIIENWITEQGWKVEKALHVGRKVHLRILTKPVFDIYQPTQTPDSLVFVTRAALSERQLLRLTQLSARAELDLRWDLKILFGFADLTFYMEPSPGELEEVTIGTQLWRPAATKNNVLREALRLLQAVPAFFATIERHLSVVSPWELEDVDALPAAPGQRPAVTLGQ